MELRAFTPEKQRVEEEHPRPQGVIVIPDNEPAVPKSPRRSLLSAALRRIAGVAAFALFLSGLGATAFLILNIW